MTDAFAELGFDRRPWLDPAAVRERYHELAAARHPDKCGGDPAPLARLNEARATLSSPPLRLRHLLDLDAPRGPDAEKFEPDFGLFARVGNLTKQAGELAGKMPVDTPPLAAAVARSGAARLAKEIASALDGISLRTNALEEKIRSFDAAWPDVDRKAVALAAEEFSYLIKWAKSLRSARALLVGG